MSQGVLKRAAVVMIATGLIATVAGSDAGASPSAQSGCLPHRAHAVAEDRDVRVYSLKTVHEVGTQRYLAEVTYACLLRNGVALKLTDPKTHRPATNSVIALNGPIIAYTYTAMGIDSGETEIVSANVATRRRFLTAPNAAGYSDACIIGFREVKDLVVTDHGAVAWTLRKGRGCKTETFQVYEATVSGGSNLLEESLGIDPASLRVSKNAVSWENDGKRHYARLP